LFTDLRVAATASGNVSNSRQSRLRRVLVDVAGEPPTAKDLRKPLPISS